MITDRQQPTSGCQVALETNKSKDRELENRKETKTARHSTFLHSPKHLTRGLTYCWQTETSAGKLTFLSLFIFLLFLAFHFHNTQLGDIKKRDGTTGWKQDFKLIVCNSFHN